MFDMPASSVTSRGVQVTFLLDRDELAAVTGARVRSYLRRAKIIMAVVIVVVVLLIVTQPWPTTTKITVIVPLAAYSLLVFWLWRPQRIGQQAVKRQLRDNPWLTSPVTVELDPMGVRIQTATSSAACSWAHYPCRVQTDDMVLLLASPGRGAAGQPISLRAVAPEHRPALLALLAEHTQLIS
jgi:hypothetical protein